MAVEVGVAVLPRLYSSLLAIYSQPEVVVPARAPSMAVVRNEATHGVASVAAAKPGRNHYRAKVW